MTVKKVQFESMDEVNRFLDLIQTGSVHFDKFLCLNGSKLCTGSLYIQCCIVFYRSITASCQNIGRIASVSV